MGGGEMKKNNGFSHPDFSLSLINLWNGTHSRKSPTLAWILVNQPIQGFEANLSSKVSYKMLARFKHEGHRAKFEGLYKSTAFRNPASLLIFCF